MLLLFILMSEEFRAFFFIYELSKYNSAWRQKEKEREKKKREKEVKIDRKRKKERKRTNKIKKLILKVMQ